MSRSSLYQRSCATCSGFLIPLILLTSCSTLPYRHSERGPQHALISDIRNVHHQHLSAQPSPEARLHVPGHATHNENASAIRTFSHQPLQALSGIAISVKRGYVHSPYTNPPRIIDVRGLKAGTPVLCPYSKKVFVVPREAVKRNGFLGRRASQPSPSASHSPQPPRTNRLVESPPETRPTPARKVVSPTSVPSTRPGPGSTATGSLSTKPLSVPSVKTRTPPPSRPEPESDSDSDSDSNSTGSGTSEEPAAPKLSKKEPPPLGKHIPGKPGFVFSPFAEKHQLVNAEGLAPGIAVRCPYSGKIFRIPVEPVSQSDPHAASGAATGHPNPQDPPGP